MPGGDSFADVMARLRGGDAAAAEEVFRRYAFRLAAMARGRLGPLIRSKEDPEDVIQSVFKSFFRRHAEGQLAAGSWEDLWGLLVVITLHKCGHRLDYFRAARRDVRREVVPAPAGESADGWEAAAPDPTPAEFAILSETVLGLRGRLEDRDRQIFDRSLGGESAEEIGRALAVSERTVERGLRRIRDILERMRLQDAGRGGGP
jgi:RNA polymerase sigma-70 factor (ECF subfamily)